MSKNNTRDYWDNRDDGHVDTREQNFNSDHLSKNLDCDMGIDVER